MALIESIDAQRVQLRDRLKQGGYTPVLFADVPELLTALGSGARFDLVVIAECGTAAWGQLSAVCGVIGMPALLLARETDCDQATGWFQNFPVSPLFDFTSVDSQNGELFSRMHTLLHRAGERHDQSATAKETVFGDYEFREGLHTVMHRGQEIYLQPRQFDLAHELFLSMGRVLERHHLWASLWGEAFPPQRGRSLDVCVASVRKKLQLCPENGFTLNAVYSRGYQLRAVTPLRAPTLPPALASELTSVARTRVDWAVNSLPPLYQAAPSR